MKLKDQNNTHLTPGNLFSKFYVIGDHQKDNSQAPKLILLVWTS